VRYNIRYCYLLKLSTHFLHAYFPSSSPPTESLPHPPPTSLPPPPLQTIFTAHSLPTTTTTLPYLDYQQANFPGRICHRLFLTFYPTFPLLPPVTRPYPAFERLPGPLPLNHQQTDTQGGSTKAKSPPLASIRGPVYTLGGSWLFSHRIPC